jgi:hypothetical protein
VASVYERLLSRGLKIKEDAYDLFEELRKKLDLILASRNLRASVGPKMDKDADDRGPRYLQLWKGVILKTHLNNIVWLVLAGPPNATESRFQRSPEVQNWKRPEREET